ncbi:MAG: LuxR C-terminal-related transcriptional regulator [Actinomycetota bacterium]|nr:LuxR C-terminal-related transcriptional regulator [Actinomycetota bacterium]
MSSALVTTKLAAPHVRGALVPRPRLTALMDAGAEATLTLVSAPAGFGKTTVLAAWLTRSSTEPRRAVFVSLDESDSHAASFWLYAVTALNSVAPGLGAGALQLLAAGQPATRAMLTAVLNEVGDLPNEVDLILDDYHLADSPEVAEGMTFLLERRPMNLHVVLSTRADPNLPLARLRARGELVEIRARDLRFTVDETASYLADVGGLVVAPAGVSVLESRTEGWAAALQLASLSMQGRDDVGGFIAGFAGTDRHVVDYLADEVLSRQSDEVRDFLERTSILELLGGDLCDAVLDRTGSRAMLERLERANLFLVPLDDQRTWFRYHHLFADVLRSHLLSERAELVPGLHLRASRWYDVAGEPVPAVRHALAAGDVDRAADLVEAATPAMRRSRQEATLRRWLDDVPDEVVQRRPVLALAFVGALMSGNEFGDVGRRLREIERHLPAIHARLARGGDSPEGPGSQVDAIDMSELARVPAAIEMYWAGLSLVSGDFPATHRHAQLAIDTATAEDDVVPAGAAGLSGLAHWACGELDAARSSYVTCIGGLRRAHHVSDALGCYLTVADIQVAQGRLREADATYGEAMAVATSTTGESPRGTADIHVAYGRVALERGDLKRARDQLAAARGLGEDRGLPSYAYRSRAVAAMLAEVEGDVPGALELVLQAQQVYLGDFSPNVRPLHAAAARLHIQLGDLDSAERWARNHDVNASQDLSYLREYEHVTLAEATIARGRHLADESTLAEADRLLLRLLDAATAGCRDATVIEVLLLQALASYARDDAPTALAHLDRAVRLAEPEGQVYAFARQGPLVLPLMESLADSPAGVPYTHVLVAACIHRVAGTRTDRGVTPQQPAGSSGLAEQLSARELEVLHLLDTELDGPEIAQRMFVSINTLRTHTKSIYSKLGVNNRHAAVRRGRELGLATGP